MLHIIAKAAFTKDVKFLHKMHKICLENGPSYPFEYIAFIKAAAKHYGTYCTNLHLLHK